ncbi:MAG: DUF4136 domain-containing protein, partial [Calditrichaeota bacterium]
MHKQVTGLSLSLLILLSGCSPISVRTDYDREVDFAHYRTFKWMPRAKQKKARGVPVSPLVDKRIRRAVERELASKGYVISQSGRADALLAYHVVVHQHMDVTAWGYGYRGWRYPRYRARRYREGTLIVDIVDPVEKKLVWRGWATGVLAHDVESDKKIRDAVAK